MDAESTLVPTLIHAGRWVVNARFLIHAEDLERSDSRREVEVQMMSGTRLRLVGEEASRFWDHLLAMIPSGGPGLGTASLSKVTDPDPPGVIEPGTTMGG